SARAGRHLINELFTGTDEISEAFHPPRIVTPAQFLESLVAYRSDVASEAQSLLAWKQVLVATRPAALAPLFPVVPRERKGAWAYAVARQIMSLRARLGGNGWDFRAVAERNLAWDTDRWNVLGRLEADWL